MNTPRAGWVDGLQYGNWSRTMFEQMRAANLSAVHATVAYHEGFRPTVDRIVAWNWRFRAHADLILPGRSAADLMRALSSNRTAIVLGLQNPLPIEDDLGLVAVLHELGIRVMQLTYNNQSLLGCGWQEAEDSGLTRFGREVVREMNRLGMLIDLSHAGERTALDAIATSKRPVAVTHATPAVWREGKRQVSETLLRALAESGGMLGLSLYPHHLRDGSATTLAAFCEMAARTAEIVGVAHLGIGSDLCQDQPDEVIAWMREGKWTRPDPSQPRPSLPPQPDWFQDSRDFAKLAEGLRGAGFAPADVEAVLGTNWQRFFRAAFRPGFEG
jgi:microsomal dipeptidase-like Zn-dependent dipeptidase